MNNFKKRTECSRPLHYAIRRNPHRRSGFTLVEMLIAMLISLILIGGMVQLFIQSKTSYKMQEGIAQAQTNGSISLYFLEKNIRRAGHPWDGVGTQTAFFRNRVGTGAFTNGNTIPVEGAGGPDALVMQFRAPAGGVSDCIGNTVDTNVFVTMQFFLDGDGLTCESITNTAGLDSAVLINGITDLQFEYGVDTDNDGGPNGDYRTADAVNMNEWARVVAVKAQVTVAVEPANLTDNATRLYTTTIPIRNQITAD